MRPLVILLYPQSGGRKTRELVAPVSGLLVFGSRIFTEVIGRLVDGSSVEVGEGFLLKGQQTRGVDPMYPHVDFWR